MKIITSKVRCMGRNPMKEYYYSITIENGDTTMNVISDGTEKTITNAIDGSVQAVDNTYKFGIFAGDIYKIWSDKKGKEFDKQQSYVKSIVQDCIGFPITFPIKEGKMEYTI